MDEHDKRVQEAEPWPEGYEESMRDLVRGGAYLSPVQCACLFDALDAARARALSLRIGGDLIVACASLARAAIGAALSPEGLEAARRERDQAATVFAHGEAHGIEKAALLAEAADGGFALAADIRALAASRGVVKRVVVCG